MDEMNVREEVVVSRGAIMELEEKIKDLEATKPWWKSKTLRINLLLLMVAFLTWLAGDQFPFDLGQYGELVAVALAIVNVVLRFMTGQPIALKTNGK